MTFSNNGICECNKNETNKITGNETDQREVIHFTRSAPPCRATVLQEKCVEYTMPIRVICKKCLSKINAKDELLGQVRRCPKCAEPLLIQPEQETAAVPVPPPVVKTAAPAQKQPIQAPKPVQDQQILVHNAAPTLGSVGNFPRKLNFLNKYFVLGPDRLLATWENGQGWSVNVGNGFLPAKRNPQAIPDQGTFALVELAVNETPEGHKLSGIRFYKVSGRGALMALTRNEDDILSKIDSAVPLLKMQKVALITHLRKQFMGDFLSHAEEIMEFLSNDDLTSTEVGQFQPLQ
ncbi:MAG: hypothetical protein ACRC2T_10765 [Thermoguttaceae bacterium]